MAKKTIKPVKPAKKAAPQKGKAIKKAVKTAKKVAPVKKKTVEKAKPVTSKKAGVSKSKTVAKKAVVPAQKKNVKKAMPTKTVKKAVIEKAIKKGASVKRPVEKAVKKSQVVAKSSVAKEKNAASKAPKAKETAKKQGTKKITKVAPSAKPILKKSAVKKVVEKPGKSAVASKTKSKAKVVQPKVRSVAKPLAKVAVKGKADVKVIAKAKELTVTAKKGVESKKDVKDTTKNQTANAAKKVIPSKSEIDELLSEVKNLPIETLIADEPVKLPKKKPVDIKKAEFSERPKPRLMEFKGAEKPAANPVFVVTPEGMANVKFAPVAAILKNEKEKKESTSDMKTSNRFAFVEGDNKNTGITIEHKLRALYDVQIIDSWIDKIHATRGELPLEVEDLENEVAGLNVRLNRMQDEAQTVLTDIAEKKQGIKDAEAQIKRYKEQLDKVKNNREYEALNKEIEFQELEIQLFKKKIREGEAQHETKLAALEAAQQKLEARTNDLEFKKQQLKDIIAETEKEEAILLAKSNAAKTLIDQRLLDAYERIRKGANNGLAVVPIDREASAGSFIHIPPQKQMDVAARKKVIIDEHSGRILVDSILAQEETEKIQSELNKELGK
jgi:predicted  nucleic acid-binding Zn-ribbon protein